CAWSTWRTPTGSWVGPSWPNRQAREPAREPPRVAAWVQTGTSPAPPPGTMEGEQSKKPLDPLVKTALAICIGLIVITVVGMILTAPDRSIPPYSVVAQIGEAVTVSVPPQTTEPEIEALLVRFQVVGHGERDGFARLKIKPTTPDDPAG